MNTATIGILVLLFFLGRKAAFDASRWNITNHGANPYTEEGLRNVRKLAPQFRTVLDLVDGRLTSAFRSDRVNRIVNGHKQSKHKRGRALDLVPRAMTFEEAADVIRAAADAGELRYVLRVNAKHNHVHVEFVDPFAEESNA